MRKILTLAALLICTAPAYAGRRDGWIGRFFADWIAQWL